MKPKNQVFCLEIGRTKVLFETQEKADRFIDFNKNDIELENGVAPTRSYYCAVCGGWHTTSMKYIPKNRFNTDSLVQAHKRTLEQRKNKTDKADNGKSKREKEARVLIDFLSEKITILHDASSNNDSKKEIYDTCQRALKKLQSKKGIHGVDLKIYEFEAKLTRLKKYLK